MKKQEVWKFMNVNLWNDVDAQNPSDEDGWKLYSFSSRHTSFRNPDTFFQLTRDHKMIPKLWLRAKLKAGTAFLLSYYEHGQSLWTLKGEAPSCQFDTVGTAGVLVWEEPIKNLGPKTFEARQKDARAFCETYTNWCNGNVYGYTIEDEDGESDSSSSGWYDPAEMAMEIRAELHGELATVGGEAAWLADYHDFTSPPEGTLQIIPVDVAVKLRKLLDGYMDVNRLKMDLEAFAQASDKGLKAIVYGKKDEQILGAIDKAWCSVEKQRAIRGNQDPVQP